jgi:hypothetical protein
MRDVDMRGQPGFSIGERDNYTQTQVLRTQPDLEHRRSTMQIDLETLLICLDAGWPWEAAEEAATEHVI